MARFVSSLHFGRDTCSVPPNAQRAPFFFCRISTAAANALRPRLRELIEGDAQEMLLQRVEENAANPEAGVSGLGFLTMITDYDAQLGWRLRAPEGEGERLQFHTMARLPIFRT